MSPRFRPTRAGVVNLWDYGDEEFVFAGGRLVLRGPNGSGKTKALEVLFPFVLDGRIEPRRLNPFASEDRTMKSNLLYRRQDAAHAYVWMEFTHDDGTAVTVGVGLRAQRHNDKVTRWYFVTGGRVGVDFSILGPDDRPLTRKQLVAELGPDAITDRAPEYRAMIDTRLFGLGPQRYEQLLTLVLTLRRPQLAKHLDPKRLSQTLSDGLRPLDDELIVEAARSFDDMETVQRTLDELVQADTAAGTFLASYTTYLRTHARAAADVLAGRLAEVDRARTALVEALAARRDAATRLETADTDVVDMERALGRFQATLESLQKSTAYTHLEQLDKLTELVEELAKAARRERVAASRATAVTERLTGELGSATAKLADARHAISRSAAALAEDAADAGIAWSATDAEPDAEFDDRVLARVELRRDDVREVRGALQAVREALAERLRYERLFGSAQDAVTEAEAAERAATEHLARVRADAFETLASWWSRHEPTMSEHGLGEVPEHLGAALTLVGEPDAPALDTVFDELTAPAAQALRRGLHERQGERRLVGDELATLCADQDRIAAEQDDAPAPFAARTASRVDSAGAPLWRLVRFVEDLPVERAASVEAALEAANLLDAWLDADDGGTSEALRRGLSDGRLVPLPEAGRPAGATLADVLVPEDDGEVGPDRIRAVLTSIALADVDPSRTAAPTVSLAGAFAQGVQVGAHTKADAEFVGATARRRRREARLAEIATRIAVAEENIASLEQDIARIESTLANLATARQELPRTGAIVRSLRAQTDQAGALRARRDALDSARSNLDQAVAEVGDRDRKLTKVAAEHSVTPSIDAVDRVASALDGFHREAGRLTAARKDETTRAEVVDAATRRLDDATHAAAEQAETAFEAEQKHGEQAAGLATLRAAVGADVDRVLADIAAARTDIDATEVRVRQARGEQNDASAAAGAAGATVTGAVDTLRSAITETQTDAHRLAPYAHREITDLLRLPVGVAWPGAEQDWRDPAELCAVAEQALAEDPAGKVVALPEAVTRLHDEIRATTTDLSPTESSLKSSKTRLSTALNELQAQLSAAGHDYRPEWEADDDVIVVRVADDQGFAPIGAFARRIADARRDQEQLLTESERRILEDALLGRLAQQIHERTIDARDLIGRMSTEMRARRMSSGATIGVHWELADTLDDGQRETCRLLDRDASRLSPDELARMRAHFAGRIKTTRAQHPDRAYAELLGEVLDYRRWRTFAFTLVAGDGTEERLTQSRTAHCPVASSRCRCTCRCSPPPT
ncbi:TIGR02680 family protein [Actinophytocola sp.]|uniref:TIGR02680 family protein n=1 Tax=Actinophytocola sp. TaxID=1872138 RepID=UPI0025BD9263|nr:TIGR02680 family protein [Actinophytocola sp.]